MTVASAYQVLRSGWLVLLVGALVGLAAGATVSALTPTTYAANSAIYVAENPYARPAGPDLVSSMLFSSRLASYEQVAVSDAVLDPVAARLGIPGGGRALAGSVAVTLAPESTVLSVSVTGSEPRQTVAIADGVADQFSALIAATERTPGSPESTVRATVVNRAVSPPAVAGSRTNANLALGLLAGVVVAAAVVLGRALLDRSVRESDALAAAVECTALGTVPTDGAIDGDDEPWRRVRDHLVLTEAGQPYRALAVVGTAAGSGAATLVVRLGRALASDGRVLVVDADLRHGALSTRLGVGRNEVGLADVLAGRVSTTAAIRSLDDVDVLPAGTVPSDPGAVAGGSRLSEVLGDLRGHYDRLLVVADDLSSSLDGPAVARATDGVLVIHKAGTSTAAEVTGTVRPLTLSGTAVVGAVLTAEGPPASRGNGRPLDDSIVSSSAPGSLNHSKALSPDNEKVSKR